jgi:ribose 5-phosphate isomerase B
MKLAFGSDHAGFALREELAKWAESAGHEVAQFGATGPESYDYPDAADLIAREVLQGNANFGVLVCGSGIGVDIRANRHEHVRAANCVTTQMAQLCREHNHANVLCLGARLMDSDEGKAILQTFLDTAESQEQRHLSRVEKIDRDVSIC